MLPEIVDEKHLSIHSTKILYSKNILHEYRYLQYDELNTGVEGIIATGPW